MFKATVQNARDLLAVDMVVNAEEIYNSVREVLRDEDGISADFLHGLLSGLCLVMKMISEELDQKTKIGLVFFVRVAAERYLEKLEESRGSFIN